MGKVGSLLGSCFRGCRAIYWGPQKGPEFRELPTCYHIYREPSIIFVKVLLRFFFSINPKPLNLSNVDPEA